MRERQRSTPAQAKAANGGSSVGAQILLWTTRTGSRCSLIDEYTVGKADQMKAPAANMLEAKEVASG
jgi:hypothetical protein